MKEKEVKKFMKEVLDFLMKNQCYGINRNIDKRKQKYYVMIEFRKSKWTSEKSANQKQEKKE